MSRQTVVVLGDVMVDVVTAMSGPVAVGSDTPSTVTLRGGGSGANVAAWLGAGASWPVVFVGAVGDDVAGRTSVESLEGCGVDPRIAVVDGRSTGTCVVLVTPDGERSMLPDAGANDCLLPEHLPVDEFRPGRHLHVTGYSLLRTGSRDAALAALDLAAERRMTVSLDPSSEALVVAAGVETVRGWCSRADLLLANTDEARVLTGEPDLRRGAAARRAACGPRRPPRRGRRARRGGPAPATPPCSRRPRRRACGCGPGCRRRAAAARWPRRRRRP